MGPKGRWKNNLINKLKAQMQGSSKREKVIDDNSISPKIRQLLLHWAYEVTPQDLK